MDVALMHGSPTIELSAATFRDLRSLIYDQTGIFFQDNKKYVLESRLQSRLRERHCASYEAYCHLLRFEAWRDKELAIVFDLITTHETYFYRDLPQLEAFTGTIVPAVMQRNASTRHVRIWSAACSTGDEPYTLAMLLLEQPALANWSIEILGSDLSEAALATARHGVYGAYAVRNVPPDLVKKYFSVEGGQYTVVPAVKRLVRFDTVNLYDPARVKTVRDMDVVFCRNCLIYFDEKAKQKIVGQLSECVRPGGYFLIGFSESLHGLSMAFHPMHAHRTVIYQKPEVS